MLRRGEQKRAWLVVALATVGLVTLLVPVTASAPCTSSPDALDTADGNFGAPIDLAPVPCRSSQKIGTITAQGGRDGRDGEVICPGFCSGCGCTVGVPK